MKLRMIVITEAQTNLEASSAKPVRRDYALVSTKGKKASSQAPPPVIKIEVVETTPKDREELRKQKGVIASSLRMPIKLIKPFASTATEVTKPPKESWGIAAVNAGQSDFTGAGVTVAILDTGIDEDHPAFKGVKIISENFTDESREDLDGHGTHCAGTIFGRDVKGTRIGIARGVSKALIAKVIDKDGGSTESIANAINWALLNQAHIISMSLGIDFPGLQKELMDEHKLSPEEATSIALAGYRDCIRTFDKLSELYSGRGSTGQTAIFAVAAGNESNRPDYSITVAPPAAGQFFLSTAAVGRPTGRKGPFFIARFSNEGAAFAAPGVDIWSAKRGGGLEPMSGTSMAAPHVAGVAALWAEKMIAQDKEKFFSASRTIEAMEKSAKSLEPDIGYQDARHGLVQAPVR